MHRIKIIFGSILVASIAGFAGAQGLSNGSDDAGSLNADPGGFVGQGFGGAGYGSAQLYAVINRDGSRAPRGKGDLSSAKLSTGNYEVKFWRNIRTCSYQATIGATSLTGGSESPGFITVANRAGTTNGVFVTTADIDGISADRSFHLYVDC